MLLILLISCTYKTDNGASDIIVGNISILNNGNIYEPYRRMEHAGRDGVSASGEPLEIDSIANKLDPINIEFDFEILIDGKPEEKIIPINNRRYVTWQFFDSEWVRTLLIPDDSEYEGTAIRYTDSFIDVLEKGEYIVVFEERWGTTDTYIIYGYYFKIVIG